METACIVSLITEGERIAGRASHWWTFTQVVLDMFLYRVSGERRAASCSPALLLVRSVFYLTSEYSREPSFLQRHPRCLE